ncbi:hypothetical protein [Streptomyces tibetensis]|uniref:hypothetical protein n=1 Tax=Streptomyces tibetensis TaxID=2382123 RepID=UPI003F540652
MSFPACGRASARGARRYSGAVGRPANCRDAVRVRHGHRLVPVVTGSRLCRVSGRTSRTAVAGQGCRTASSIKKGGARTRPARHACRVVCEGACCGRRCPRDGGRCASFSELT